MSIYVGAVDAYRDTVKWLVAFVPVASLGAAAVLVGPPLTHSVASAESGQSWLADHWLVVICGLALVGGLGLMLRYGARVLSITPRDIGALATGSAGAQRLSEAIGAGVAAPDFFTAEAFDEEMGALAEALDDATKEVKADDPRLARIQRATDALRAWSTFEQMRRAYRDFRVAFVVGVVLVLGAVVAAPLQLTTSEAITAPTPVEVTINPDRAGEVEVATGCTSAQSSTFTAVRGTWDQPVLLADGPDCRFGAEWRPSRDVARIRAKAG